MQRLLLILWRTSRADLRLAWHALKHPSRPVWLLPALVLLGLYALSPHSYVVPPLGLVDDLVIVPLLLHALMRLLPTPLRQDGLRAAPLRNVSKARR